MNRFQVPPLLADLDRRARGAHVTRSLPEASAVSELLANLKQRSGRTFEGVARRSGLSRSTVHRYCSGLSLPDTFAPLEALALVLGASPAEIAELFRLWSAARAGPSGTTSRHASEPAAGVQGPPAQPAAEPPAEPAAEPPAEPAAEPPAEPAAESAASPDGAVHLTVPGDEPSTRVSRQVRDPVEVLPTLPASAPATSDPVPEREQRGIRRRVRSPGFVAALVLIVLSLAGFAFGWPDIQSLPARDHPTAAGEQVADGPAWMSDPQPVSPDFFGVTMNSTTGHMPDFRVGAVRLWDSGTTWASLEPSRGAFRWDRLDRLVDGARKGGLPVLFTVGGTPAWASPDGTRMSYGDGSRSAPPDDLSDWDAFISALTHRYAGRIQAYELWVLAPGSLYFSGSAAELVAMTVRAAETVRRNDPGATVVCPSMGELWEQASRDFLTEFAALGGYRHCDVAGVKLHPREFRQPPETIASLVAMIDRTFHDAGLHLPIWSTGTTYRIASADRLDEVTARNYAVRLFLISLYARYQRMYFYNWGGRKLPIVLQAEGGPPTSAARYVERLEKWLSSAQIYSCGAGPQDGLPKQTWRCRFAMASEAPRARTEAEIIWTSVGDATLTATRDGVLRTLDGTEQAVRRGDRFPVGEAPVMIEHVSR